MGKIWSSFARPARSVLRRTHCACWIARWKVARKLYKQNAPSVLDCLDEECTAHFQKVQDILTANGIAFTIDPKIVRGLDYYTRTVAMSLLSDGLTVCGGGGG